MSGDLNHLLVLKALQEIPFGVGKKLLTEFLQGKEKHESITKNQLQKLASYGSMAYSDNELSEVIERLVLNGLIQMKSIDGNRFWKVMEISDKGVSEISNPTLHTKQLSFAFSEEATTITEDDKKKFAAFGEFLEEYNDEQKKAIIGVNSHLLCIAGAGSGKTTVLTKRIEFLVKYKSVAPSSILAITFTRKARQEMMKRLPNSGVAIETFNSFCEKMLRTHGDLLYGRSVRVVSYRDKILMFNKALSSIGISLDRAIDQYFSLAQRRSKTPEQLSRIFMHDCFFIRDYFKFKNKKIEKSAFETVDADHQKSADLVFSISNFIESFMTKNGLRDFADQLIDTLRLFTSHPNLIPSYSHILIDEFQDVNKTQMELVDVLKSSNLFCVGDPRQSIFGWRGSNIKYILGFAEKFFGSETIVLTKNYRSSSKIVDLMNAAISKLGLASLESCVAGSSDIKLEEFSNADEEFGFVVDSIAHATCSPSEIFVLARTNRQLNELSLMLKQRRIPHIVRSDEMKKPAVDSGGVTLATVHAIKGMEAEMVIVVGCTTSQFPCKASEHPVVEMVKVDTYDREEEERRLFYVALSRAKSKLYMTYTGKKPTHYLTEEMMLMVDSAAPKRSTKLSLSSSSDVVTKLKEWRTSLSSELGVPPYMVMHDKTLFDLAVKMPLDVRALENVIGLGPAKIAKYGEQILDVLIG